MKNFDKTLTLVLFVVAFLIAFGARQADALTKQEIFEIGQRIKALNMLIEKAESELSLIQGSDDPADLAKARELLTQIYRMRMEIAALQAKIEDALNNGANNSNRVPSSSGDWETKIRNRQKR